MFSSIPKSRILWIILIISNFNKIIQRSLIIFNQIMPSWKSKQKIRDNVLFT